MGEEQAVARSSTVGRKSLIVAIVGVFIAFLIHPLVGGIAAGLVAWLARSLERKARMVFAVCAPLFVVYGLFFSFIPFGLGN